MKIVATTSWPAVDRPNADRWNAARSRQQLSKMGNGYSHYLYGTIEIKETLRLYILIKRFVNFSF